MRCIKPSQRPGSACCPRICTICSNRTAVFSGIVSINSTNASNTACPRSSIIKACSRIVRAPGSSGVIDTRSSLSSRARSNSPTSMAKAKARTVIRALPESIAARAIACAAVTGSPRRAATSPSRYSKTRSWERPATTSGRCSCALALLGAGATPTQPANASKLHSRPVAENLKCVT